MQWRRADVQDLEIRWSDGQRPYFVGFQTCGSVWACPVCAAKIQAVRGLEVQSGIDAWISQGGTVLLRTQTVPHSRAELLKDVLGGLQVASKGFTGGRPMRKLRDQTGSVGSIRALEVTWSNRNGFHPHLHTLEFFEGPVDREEVEAEQFRLWESATARAGFGELSRDAFSVQDGSQVKRYVTKLGAEYQWGPAQELVRSHSKRGRNGSMSPFDFLAAYVREEDRRYLKLFEEFAWTFRGRRQLVWSPGFKKRLLGSEGLSDEQVAESISQEFMYYLMLSWEDWKLARAQLKYPHQSFLGAVELKGEQGFYQLLDSLRSSRGEEVSR